MDQDQLNLLNAYARGERGTRETIDALGMHDYADLVIALAVNDMPFPKPSDTPERRRHLSRATEILQPLLRAKR